MSESLPQNNSSGYTRGEGGVDRAPDLDNKGCHWSESRIGMRRRILLVVLAGSRGSLASETFSKEG